MVKVCGLTRAEDAAAVARHGATLAGFIFHPPSPRNMTVSRVAAIGTGGLLRVGVFVGQDADEVRRIMEEAGLHLAQLAGDQDRDFCNAVGRLRVLRVFRPERHARVLDLEEEMQAYAGCMRMALLDAGSSGGGHGRTLDFSSLAGLRAPCPWFLAGGLGPHNLAQALSACAPAGVDLNSGLESAPGIKDHARIAAALALLNS